MFYLAGAYVYLLRESNGIPFYRDPPSPVPDLPHLSCLWRHIDFRDSWGHALEAPK